MNIRDIVGQRFGRLVVIDFDHSKKVGKKKPVSKRFYKVKCDCGNETIVCKENLTSGTTTSCGCFAREEIKKRNAMFRLPNNESHWNLYYHNHKKGALTRGLSTSLTLEQFKEICQKDCYYCGQKPSLKKHSNLYGEVYLNGIDRVDSDKPYDIDNIKPCCGMCNKMKLNHTEKDFLEKIKKIYENRIIEQLPIISKALNYEQTTSL